MDEKIKDALKIIYQECIKNDCLDCSYGSIDEEENEHYCSLGYPIENYPSEVWN